MLLLPGSDVVENLPEMSVSAITDHVGGNLTTTYRPANEGVGKVLCVIQHVRPDIFPDRKDTPLPVLSAIGGGWQLFKLWVDMLISVGLEKPDYRDYCRVPICLGACYHA